MKGGRTWCIAQTGICIFFLFLAVGNTAFPQDYEHIILPKYFSKLAGEIKKENKNEIEKKISGLLKLQVQLRNSYKEQPTPERLDSMKKMGMRTVKEEIDQQLVYIHTKKKLSLSKISSLKKMGIVVYEDSWVPPLENHPTGYVIASMPVDRLYDLAEKNFVIQLETAEKALSPKNDEAAKSIQADDVWNDYGYDGSGVRIAVLDSGLDTTHNDIPAPVASKDYSDHPNLDDTIENEISEHGTHVTGSVLGRGTQSSGKYKGIAYGADLIFLKIGNDSTGGASSAAMTSAIKAAVDSYDADIINISYGGFDAYLDGTNEEDQAVDYAFSKGALVFIAAGNEADDETHYSGTVSANSTTDYIKVNVGEESIISFYLNWYDGKGTRNDLDISLYDNNKNQISSNFTKIEYNESSRGTECELIYYNNSVYESATYYLRVMNNASSNQAFHIYSLDDNVTFENADSSYTIGSPATADDAIAVGSYISRKTWTDYKGDSWKYIDNPTVGNISSFSSHGPRIDGVKKPDITAPGQGIISARDKIVTWPGDNDARVIDNDGTNNGEGPADYFVSKGTSMACPIAAGAAALLMQANPSLKGDPDSIRNALFQSASNGGTQDNTYGYGKIDVSAALSFITTSTTPTPTPPPTVNNYVVKESLMTGISSDEFYGEYDGCKTPPEKTIFYDTDSHAAIWFSFENAEVGDTVEWKWYSPDDSLYKTGNSTYNYTSGCWRAYISINGTSAETKLGQWQVKVYRNDQLSFTKTFTIQKATSSPTPSPTPTSSSCTDSYEPNDNYSDAYGPLSSGSSYSGKICSGNDTDWFKINITDMGNISLSLTVPSSNDYELELYNPSNTKVASSANGTGSSESISYDATTTGNYYIKIYGYNGSYNTSNSYTLAYTYTASTTPTPSASPTPTVSPTTTSILTGNVNGSVVDIVTGNPVIGATVSTDTGGFTATTDDNGDYVLLGIDVGDYELTVEADGYYTATETVTVVEGQFVTINFALLPESVTPTPTEVIDADIFIRPKIINLTKKRKFKAFIELPSPYSVHDINIDTVECNGAQAINARIAWDQFIATFRTQDLGSENYRKGKIQFTVSGELVDGTRFEGSDDVRIKNK